MIRFILQRIGVLTVRLLVAALVLVVLIEAGFGILGGTDQHVWSITWDEPVPEEVASAAAEVPGWIRLLGERLLASLPVVGMAWGGALLVGSAWGLLGARFRRFQATSFLAAPWSLLACAPAFWIVVAVAVYSYSAWQRPGFADELRVESGPNLLYWWNAAIVALPLLGMAAAWQIRAVSGVIVEEASQPFVKGLFLAGYRDEDIFHRNVVRRCRPALISLVDRTLPAVLGGLVVVEPAFRFQGLGAMLADSIRSAAYPGILLSAGAMVGITGVAVAIREILVARSLRED